MDYTSAFPVKIDLGHKESADMAIPMSSESTKGKRGKPRTFYPTLYVDAVEGLEQLPKEGYMLVKFRRKSLRIDEDKDGKEKAGVTLEIRQLCLPEDMAGEGADDLDAVLSRYGKDAAKPEETDEEDED